jgi:hypothetical protein
VRDDGIIHCILIHTLTNLKKLAGTIQSQHTHTREEKGIIALLIPFAYPLMSCTFVVRTRILHFPINEVVRSICFTRTVRSQLSFSFWHFHTSTQSSANSQANVFCSYGNSSDFERTCLNDHSQRSIKY